MEKKNEGVLQGHWDLYWRQQGVPLDLEIFGDFRILQRKITAACLLSATSYWH